MRAVPIRVWGDPVLRRRAAPADPKDPKLAQLVETMLATMRDAQGLGLAAPQIGVGLRVAVVDRKAGHLEDDLILINPVLEGAWGETTVEEGCLSLPGIWVEMTRASHVRVRYLDLEGKHHSLKADDMLAVAIQHELDHLDGILLVDRIPPEARKGLTQALERIRAEAQACESSP